MEAFIGSMLLWPLNWAPIGWLLCQGQILSISQNTALFALLGTQYGGDGRTTFALPDLRSRVPLGAGQGAGLSNYTVGQVGGSENVTLTTQEIASHAHAVAQPAVQATAKMPASGQLATTATPGVTAGGTYVPAKAADFAAHGFPDLFLYGVPDGTTSFPVDVAIQGQTAASGGNQPHANQQPYLVLNYIICVNGIFPSRP